MTSEATERVPSVHASAHGGNKQGVQLATRPHIVLVIPRGEAVRNFLYSDTLRSLKGKARVTVLTVVSDDDLAERIKDYADEIIPIEEYPVPPSAGYVRTLTENAHDRWLWSQVAQNNWELRDRRSRA